MVYIKTETRKKKIHILGAHGVEECKLLSAHDDLTLWCIYSPHVSGIKSRLMVIGLCWFGYREDKRLQTYPSYI